MFEIEMVFHGDLPRFLRRGLGRDGVIRRELGEKTAVKDVIEACGIPHPEVDLIINDEHSAGFAWQVQGPGRLEVYPVPAPPSLLPEAQRLQERHWTRFVTDGHLGKLARNLRLLGIDTLYERDADDRRLLELMQAESRALLTRDRPLLMHSVVRHGYCPRSDDAEEQTREVLQRFFLGSGELRPFSRCLRCNHLLQPVSKAEVLAPLAAEPLTLRNYEAFQRCAGCGRIFWAGTHFDKLMARVARISHL
jgi:uncharacterized protein with PIN domain